MSRGLAILALFALFEKRRNDVLRVVARTVYGALRSGWSKQGKSRLASDGTSSVRPFVQAVPPDAVLWLFAGGVAYTAGVID